MKRWIGLLALVLLLTGCTPQGGPVPTGTATPTIPTTVPPTTVPEPTDPALPDVVAAWYEELDKQYQAVASMGEALLLFGDGTLSKYSDGAVTASVEAPIPLPGSGMIRITDSGICYYDAGDNALVTLDEELQQLSRIPLTEAVTGDPCLAEDGKTLYYCTASGIRVWDPDTGITRSLKIQEGSWMGISGSLFDGKYLRCQLAQEDGTVRTLLVSTENGTTVDEGDALVRLSTDGDFYCCVTEEEWIFGFRDQQPQNLFVDGAVALPQLQMALTAEQTENGLQLKLYDLNTGMLASAELFQETDAVTSPIAHQGNLVFLSGSRLCWWSYDVSAQLSPVEDETVYTAYRYTAEDPDTEGLAALQTRAETLETQFGIDILLWEDVTAAQPEGYVFEIEHRTHVYEAGFAALETALARFPEDFLKTAASWTDDGTLHIVLARSVTAPADVCGSQYLLGKNAYIVLALDESLEQTFYHALGHVIDTVVLVESDAFYEWYTVNPSGFEYDNGYTSWQDRESKYLQSGKQYFVDSYAMTFPVEDRASMFAYAMLPGNEEVFESKYMQKKLERLERGMRESFGLDGDSYPWEQYLK